MCLFFFRHKSLYFKDYSNIIWASGESDQLFKTRQQWWMSCSGLVEAILEAVTQQWVQQPLQQLPLIRLFFGQLFRCTLFSRVMTLISMTKSSRSCCFVVEIEDVGRSILALGRLFSAVSCVMLRGKSLVVVTSTLLDSPLLFLIVFQRSVRVIGFASFNQSERSMSQLV